MVQLWCAKIVRLLHRYGAGMNHTVEDSTVNSSLAKADFEFSGRGTEFFRIWIVNMFLTLLTLGIYSAWAKVRTQKYFYNHLSLLGGSFDYHASPIQILKGRLVAITALVLFTLANAWSPVTALILVALLYIATPYIMRAGFRFNTRNSSYRNIRFRFDGSLGGAYKVFMLYPLIPFVLLFGSALLLQLSIPESTVESEQLDPALLARFGLLFLFALVLAVLLLPWILFKQFEYFFSNLYLGQQRFTYTAGAASFYALMFKVIAVNIVLIVLISVIALGIVSSYSDYWDLENMQRPDQLMLSAFSLLGLMIYFVFFLLNKSAMVVFSNNINFNRLSLLGNKTQSSMGVGSFFMLNLLNLILTLLSLGLYWPFAKTAIVRYKAMYITVLHDVSFDSIINAEHRRGSAIGEELGDAFDIDLGIV